MADEKRAGPWVDRGDAWERHAPQSHHAAYGTLVASITHDSTLWWTVDGGYRNAPTPEAARAAADEALRAEGWVLEEAAGFLTPAERARIPLPPTLEMSLTGGGSDPHPVAVARSAERRAGPWELRGATWVRMGPDDTALVWAWLGVGVWEWARLPAGERGAANTATRAQRAADDVLREEGWTLEEPTRVPPGVVRVSHGTVDPPEPPPAPVVAIIRRWAADRDAGRAIGEGADVLLDELLEAVGTGRPADGPFAWMREPGAIERVTDGSVAVTNVAGRFGGINVRVDPFMPPGTTMPPRHLWQTLRPTEVVVAPDVYEAMRAELDRHERGLPPVAPPVTEARGRLVAGAWVDRGDAWERHAPQRHHALYGTLVASITHDSTVWWTVDGGYRNAPTPEVARDAADDFLRAAGWELQ